MATNSKANKKNKGRGRPKKKTKNSINSGRKHVSATNVSRRTMYRRAKALLQSNFYSEDAIMVANKRRNKNTVNNNPMGVQGKNSSENVKENSVKKLARHSNESALAFYVEYGCSKESYSGLVSDSIEHGAPIYPCYRLIEKAMEDCKVKKKYYTKSDVEISVPLQLMLNKTAERLCAGIALEWDESDLLNLELSATLGFDSSSGHTNSQQKSNNPDNEQSSPLQSLFVSSFIVIQLKSKTQSECFWINPTPQSVQFCRPLRIALEIEDKLATLGEFERLNDKIKKLRPSKFKLKNSKSVKVTFNVTQTMFDGKCINTIVGNNATCRCPMCLRTTHQFGNLDDEFPVNESWDIHGPIKEDFAKQKMLVQQRIFDKIGVRVDQVLQGHGTKNTGNVARRCFENPSLFAEALEISDRFVSRIATILLVFKSKRKLKLNELEKFCWETYKLHYELYPWARMKPSVHKLLRHGCEIARMFPLTMAYYSEDANESWHKLYRKNMVSHARQIRKDRLLDVFDRAVYSTDPKISLIYIEKRLKAHKSDDPLPADVLEFIVDSDVSEDQD